MQNRRPLRTLSRSYFRDMLPGGSLLVLCSHHMFSSVDRAAHLLCGTGRLRGWTRDLRA